MFSNDQLPTIDVPLRVINRPLPSELDEQVRLTPLLGVERVTRRTAH